MEQSLVKVAADGRMTLPAAVRHALALAEGEARLSVDIVDGGVLLRPAVIIPREDAWAYTPEHLAAVKRARAQADAGETVAFPEDIATRLTASP